MTPGDGFEDDDVPDDETFASQPPSALRRVLLGALAFVVFVVLVAAAWIAVDVLRVRSALTDARSQANDLTAQLREDGPGGEKAIARQLSRDVAHAHRITRERPWSLGRHLPIVGKDFTVLAEATSALREIASDGIPSLVALSAERDDGALSVADGKIDLAEIRRLGPELQRSDEVFTRGKARFDKIDIDGTHGPVRSGLSGISSKLGEAQSALHSGAEVMTLAPKMLGGDGPRTYLVIFQNNAEIRSTGGIPGAFAEVRAVDGAIEITRQGAGSDTGFFDPPAVAVRPDERRLYGTLGATFWQDANFTPDFPRTARILRSMYKIRYGKQLDGVISVDPIALAHVLNATGPVQVTKAVALGPNNVVPVLLNAVYAQYPNDDPAQNEFFANAASKIFSAFLGGADDPGALFAELRAGIAENRVLVNATRPSEQELFAGKKMGGALDDQPGPTPKIGLYLNDSTAAKLEYYLRRSTSVDAVSCSAAGVQTFTTRTRLTSAAPANVTSLGPSVVGYDDGATNGVMSMVMTYYAPYGGRVTALEVDGVPQTVNRATHLGLAVATVPITLPPGKSHVVTTTIVSGPGQPRDAVFRTTPGVESTPNNVRIPNRCG